MSLQQLYDSIISFGAAIWVILSFIGDWISKNPNWINFICILLLLQSYDNLCSRVKDIHKQVKELNDALKEWNDRIK
jgi:hypothetical protein